MTLPTLAFAPTQIKPIFGESYVSEAANTKFLGQPRGVYLGFVPQVTPGSLLLTLAVDPVYGVSFARMRSSLEATNVDVVTDQPTILDFTGHNFIANPTAYVKVHANSKLGSPTTAEVYTTAVPGSTLTDQLLCVVTSVLGNLVVVFDAPTNRATPYAYATAPLGYGFMRDSAVEQLLASVAMVAEVAAARVDLDGVNHPYVPIPQQGIADRIAADLLPAAVASRLGRFYHVVRSQDHFVPSPSDTIPLSSSFAKAARTRAPLITIPPNGSELANGAVTGPSDMVRNVCFVFEVGKNERPIDANRFVGYGRLDSLVMTLTGVPTFSNVSTLVTGVGTLFTMEIQPGDIILAPDGEYYVVGTITDDFNLILASIPTVGGPVVSVRRRFLLRLVVINQTSGVEQALSVPGGTTLRFFFGTFFDLSQSIHDSTLLMFEGGEEPPLPDSAVGVKGKAQVDPLIAYSALAGAVKVLDNGNPVGTGRLAYSIGFHSPPGQPAIPGASLNVTPGIANVSAAGQIGPIGPPGLGPGPPGPIGAAGLAFNSFSTLFAASADFTPPFGGWSLGQVLTHDVIFTGSIKYLHGGISLWAINSPGADNNDNFDITAVTITNPGGANNTGRIQITIPNETSTSGPPIGTYGLFLSAAG